MEIAQIVKPLAGFGSSALSFGLPVAGQVLGAIGAGKAGKFADQEAKREAQLVEIAAAETEAEHRQELDQALGAIDVALGASSFDADSPLALAAIRGTRKDFRRARIIETANLLNRASQIRREGKARLFEGKLRRNIGFLKLGATAIEGAPGLFSAFSKLGKGLSKVGKGG